VENERRDKIHHSKEYISILCLIYLSGVKYINCNIQNCSLSLENNNN